MNQAIFYPGQAEEIARAIAAETPCIQSFLFTFYKAFFWNEEKVTAWLDRFNQYALYNHTCGIVVGALVVMGLYSQWLVNGPEEQNALFYKGVAAFMLAFENNKTPTHKDHIACCNKPFAQGNNSLYSIKAIIEQTLSVLPLAFGRMDDFLLTLPEKNIKNNGGGYGG